MSAALRTRIRTVLGSSPGAVTETTLLELVWAVSEVTDDEREVVATIAHLVETGRVRLRGIFRGAPVSLR